MKKLLVISNHNPELWSNEQKKGWDKIEYVPFPNIDPKKSIEEIRNSDVPFVIGVIAGFLTENSGDDLFVNLQGEFSLCKEVFLALPKINFIFPTTERIVEEKDGKKISIFKFVRWR